MKKEQKNPVGRPRIHEVGEWSTVAFRLPKELRDQLFDHLDERNDSLAYRLSLNSLLLELIVFALKHSK